MSHRYNEGAKYMNLLSNSQFIAASGSTLEEADATAVTVTQITAGVCTCADTRSLAVGKLIRFDAGGTTANKVYEITALTANTSFTLHDTSITDATDVTGHEVTPGYVAADTLAFDGHSKTTTLDVHQFHNTDNTYGYGQYLAKLTKGADSAEYYNFLKLAINVKDCQSKSVCFGCYAYSVSKSSNVKASIIDSTGEIALSSTFVPAGAITWIELPATVSASATSVYPRILCDEATGDVCYISEPIFVRGSSIGAGNYQPIPNEVIWLQTLTRIENNTSGFTSATKNIEAWSSGRVGKGVKALNFIIRTENSAAEREIGILSGSYSDNQFSSMTQVAGVPITFSGWAGASSSGDVYLYASDAGFSGTYIDVNAIQT